MIIIIYFKCACTSSQKLFVNRLRKAGFEVRIVNNNPKWRKEAQLYNLPLPFIVKSEHDKTGRPLNV